MDGWEIAGWIYGVVGAISVHADAKKRGSKAAWAYAGLTLFFTTASLVIYWAWLRKQPWVPDGSTPAGVAGPAGASGSHGSREPRLSSAERRASSAERRSAEEARHRLTRAGGMDALNAIEARLREQAEGPQPIVEPRHRVAEPTGGREPDRSGGRSKATREHAQASQPTPAAAPELDPSEAWAFPERTAAPPPRIDLDKEDGAIAAKVADVSGPQAEAWQSSVAPAAAAAGPVASATPLPVKLAPLAPDAAQRFAHDPLPALAAYVEGLAADWLAATAERTTGQNGSFARVRLESAVSAVFRGDFRRATEMVEQAADLIPADVSAAQVLRAGLRLAPTARQ